MKRNMKRIWLVLCMAACIFSLSACDASNSEVADAEILKQQTVNFLQQIASYSDEQLEYIIEENRAGGEEAIAAGLEGYLGMKEELGNYVSSGEGTAVQTEDGYSIFVEAVFENRSANFTVGLDESKAYITSISVNPVYTMGETMIRALMNTLMGMGTVFVVLIVISLLISCFRFINRWEEGKKGGKPAPVSASVPAPAVSNVSAPVAEEKLTDDLELVAVITAAIAAASGNTSTDGLVVRSIRRVPGNHWKKA